MADAGRGIVGPIVSVKECLGGKLITVGVSLLGNLAGMGARLFCFVPDGCTVGVVGVGLSSAWEAKLSKLYLPLPALPLSLGTLILLGS